MKKIQRRQIAAVAMAMAIAGLGLGGTAALAQGGYPAKTITMIVPAAAGGTTDLAARMAAQALAPVIGQSVVVDNKGGGNGSIAASLSSVPRPMATPCSCSTRATTSSRHT